MHRNSQNITDFTSYATVYEKHHEYFSSTLVKLLIHFNFPNITWFKHEKMVQEVFQPQSTFCPPTVN